MARIPGTPKPTEPRHRCPGCGRKRLLVKVAGSVGACDDCAKVVRAAWREAQQ